MRLSNWENGSYFDKIMYNMKKISKLMEMLNMINQISKLISTCHDKDNSFITPTLIYNEGWLLRLALNWFYLNRGNNLEHELSFHKESRWYSEVLLESPFMARTQGDKKAEAYTHADGVIGNFEVGKTGKGDLAIREDVKEIKIVEAKLYSKLSAGVTNDRKYNQVARNVGCLIHNLSEHYNDIDFGKCSFSFVVVASKEAISKNKSFKEYLKVDALRDTINNRAVNYYGNDTEGYKNWNNSFNNIFKYIKINLLTWEEVIVFIKQNDSKYGNEFEDFYNKCKEFY
jgi:hypothetical protein